MKRIFVVLSVYAVFASARRRPPNVDYVEQYYGGQGPASGRYSNNLSEDASLDVPDLIRKYGYPVEVHEVVTEDGYILEMHRIPHGRDQNNVPDGQKPVVFVMHGLMSSSADWVLMGPGTALGYALAEAGFDVWLGNARGTFYSRRHVTLDPDSTNNIDFWQFSWDEFGLYDLPAMIDHALNTTGKSRLHYIGHSQGTTAFWVMGSLRPEYNRKIITMQAYAPVAYFTHNKSPVFNAIAPFSNSVEMISKLLGVGELLSRPPIIASLGSIFCSDRSIIQTVCSNMLFLLSGYSEGQHNATMFPVKLAHTPAGSSVRQLAHYGQLIGKDFFRRYDHGRMRNFLQYGTFAPPSYDLKKITAPVFLHYVENDSFAFLEDVDRLWQEIGFPIAKLKVPYEPFSHLDFMWGQKAKSVLYDRTIDIMKVYPNN